MEDKYIQDAPEEIQDKLMLARKEQLFLIDKLNLNNKINLGNVRLVAGFDTAFSDEHNLACSGVVVIDFRTLEVVEEHVEFFTPEIQYIPTFLHLREGKGYHSVYKKIEEKPDISFFDGNGILHPYRVGLATQMGIELSVPTVGIAKKLLFGKYEPPIKQGGYSEIYYDNEVLGVALQSSKQPAKPIFLSQGNLIDLSTTIHVVREIILNQVYQTKLPLPIFRVDQLVREQLKEEI
ncbi:MAG: endonuclease V [Asgard group archaeon]|nr:endonuclease V [Asgard group archaeon]